MPPGYIESRHISRACRSKPLNHVLMEKMLIQRTRTFSFFLFASILVSIQLSMTGVVAARIIRDMKFNFKLNNYARDDLGFANLPSVLLDRLDRLHIPRRSLTLPVFQE